MTTQFVLKNRAHSNGDVQVKITCGHSEVHHTLEPGQQLQEWVSTEHRIAVHETWPSQHRGNVAQQQGEFADELIAAEVAIQDKMWGDTNGRADNKNGQMLQAALAQGAFINSTMSMPYLKREVALENAQGDWYPKDWSGFRDYGSDIANLVVMSAYIRNEIKRRLLAGEGFERSSRQKPYGAATPNMSSADAMSGKTHIGRIAGVNPSPDPALTINEQAHGDDASHD